MRFIVRVLANSLAIFLASWLLPGVDFGLAGNGNLWLLFLAGLALSLINVFIKPLVKLITLPLIILTFGLFTFLINTFMLWLLVKLIPALVITGFINYLLASLIISVTNLLFNRLTKK